MTGDDRHGGPTTPGGLVRDHFSAVLKLSFAVGAANALLLSALLTVAGLAAPGAIALGAALLFIVSLSLSRRHRLHAALALAFANTLSLALVLQHRAGFAGGGELVLAALVVAAFLDRRPTRHLSVGLAVAAVLTAATLRLAALGSAPPVIDPALPRWLVASHQVGLLILIVAAAWSVARLVTAAPSRPGDAPSALDDDMVMDPLTRLPSRRTMILTITGELARSRRSQRPLSLLLLEVDHFESLLALWGRGCGDWVIVTLGNLLSRVVRSEDWVARWQPNQFLLLLPEAELQGAVTAAERIRAEVGRSSFLFDGRELDFTVSVAAAASRGELSAGALTDALQQNLADAAAAGGDQLLVSRSVDEPAPAARRRAHPGAGPHSG